ncbi:MAG: aminopeptidase [Oscillospiraceae bacterium]|jgi:leucyl aminopeptidase|nr:aminopeptidase [Oscillospiraceae bacterium]
MSVKYSPDLTPFDTLILDVSDDTLSAETPEIRALYAALRAEDADTPTPAQPSVLASRAYGLTYDGHPFTRIVFVRRSPDLTPRKLRQRYGQAAKVIASLHGENALYIPDASTPRAAFVTIAEGFLLGQYKFEKYAKRPPRVPADLTVLAPDDVRAELAEGSILAEAAYFARDLAFEPPNVATPEEIARRALDLERVPGLTVTVLGREQIRAQRLRAFLAVSQGSAREPQLIVADYTGAPESAERLALVGKGICFDSGGYCLKGGESIASMKTDMQGASVVLAAVAAIAKAKLRVNVTAVVAACENLISNDALLPGDIIEARSGALIEIVNTDAEGRLTLADALIYAIEEKRATRLVDIATLTGSCAQTFGSAYIGTFASDDEFYGKLADSAHLSGENIWRLPLAEEYKKLNRSEVAHLKNAGPRFAGAITAALFLQEFTRDLPWIHLDIAGASRSDSDAEIFTVGSTGAGTALLYTLAKNLSDKDVTQ